MEEVNLFEAANESSHNALAELSDLEIDLGDVLEENGFHQSLLDDVDLYLECEDESQDSSYIGSHPVGQSYSITSIQTGRFVKRITFRNPPDPTEEQRHYCESCSKSFTRETLLRDHRHKIHQENDLFPCSQCNYVGQLHRHLQNHRKRRHGLRNSKSDVTIYKSADNIHVETVLSSGGRTYPNEFSDHKRVHSSIMNPKQNEVSITGLVKTQDFIKQNQPEVVPVSMITNFNHGHDEESGSDYPPSSEDEESEFDFALPSNQRKNCGECALSASDRENYANNTLLPSYELDGQRSESGQNTMESSGLTKINSYVHLHNCNKTVDNVNDYSSLDIGRVPLLSSNPITHIKTGCSNKGNCSAPLHQIPIIDKGIDNMVTGDGKRKSVVSNINLKTVKIPQNCVQVNRKNAHSLIESSGCSIENSTENSQRVLNPNDLVVSMFKTNKSSMQNPREKGCIKGIDRLSATQNASVKPVKVKNFRCTFKGCDKYFRDNYNRDVHLRVHSNQMPYGCALCDYKTKQRTSLKLHVISKHTQLLT